MGLFTKKEPPAFGTSAPVTAAAGYGGRPGPLSQWTVGAQVQRALSIPTVSRGVGLITSTIAGLDFKTYTLGWNGEEYERNYIPNETWMQRPNPEVTRSFMISSTVQDLMLWGRAFWVKMTEYSTGFPASFMWIPHENVYTPNDAGPEWFRMPDDIEINGVPIDPANVVTFLSPINGMLWTGNRAIQIATELDAAALRFATNAGGIASGYLQQKDSGEPLGGEDLTELAQAWADARGKLAVGALNNLVEWRESSIDASKLQLHEGRQHAALELARVLQVPAWLVGVSISSMTYQNSQQARQDLILFGAKPYIDCLQETLSLNSVIPNGRYVELDVVKYIRDVENAVDQQEPEA